MDPALKFPEITSIGYFSLLLTCILIACKEDLDPKPLPPVEATKIEYKPGNYIANVQDSVIVHLNQSVSVRYIFSRYDRCQSDDIQWRLTHTGTVVRFNFSCGFLGFSFPLSAAITNEDGEESIVEFEAESYQGRVVTSGLINSTCYDENTKLLWAATHIPYQLLAISLDSWKVVKSVTLGYNPIDIHISPYNGKLYVSDGTRYIHVIDTTSATEQYFIEALFDEPGRVFSENIQQVVFTKSGKGVIRFGSVLRMIDAAKQDSTYSYFSSWNVPPESYSFRSVYLNHTKEKLLLVEQSGTDDVTILDPDLNLYKMIRPMGTSSTHFVATHKKEDIFFIGRLKNLGVSDLNGNPLGPLILYDIGLNGNADFNYSSSNAKEIFFADEPNFVILDMNTGEALTGYDAAYMRGLTCTLDGKYLLSYSNGGKSIYKFSTAMLKQ
jgi:hypothetical protein